MQICEYFIVYISCTSVMLMDFFKKMQLEDPSYFYSIQLDDDNQILNIFQANSRSIVDYGHFWDVICFDTTYQTNSYG